MRYGFKTAPINTTWPAMLDIWRMGDQLDVFESAWSFDHFEPGQSLTDADGTKTAWFDF
jgi:hypothetical protein